MPFTLSHSIASYLFKSGVTRGYLSATGLILGCMAPDFEYFLRMKMLGEWGHQWSGIFLFDLPVAMILAVLIHKLLRDPVILHLPKILKQRLIIYVGKPLPLGSVRYWLVLGLSILFGITTHLFWDAFTHHSGYFVQHYALLSYQIEWFGQSVYLYKVLQHLSSLGGLTLIGLYIYSLPVFEVSATPLKSLLIFWSTVIFSFLVLMLCWGSLNSMNYSSIQQSIVHILVASIANAFYAICLTVVVYKLMSYVRH